MSRRWTQGGLVAGVLLAALGCIAVTSTTSDQRQPADPAGVAEGRRLYGIYCANCHGKQARGDGPTASVLIKRPTDLTRLAAANGGEFPAQEVYDAIDGRGAEHGTREMPIWGLAFQEWDKDTYQETEVRTHIERLVAYIESLQRR